ncbi:hypothetical protein N4G70_34295 [Streptomyces sp. ASQP_92]|uniref:hypothetical protein n=1 Tax=Streptomyces sp. ASQP_92 TaxID=2979116 RepID=UPI0021BFA429|nr:hypothetical protein [Streptomyces sp. ASQP_92]MCT9093890.1 hypothetical protein [Streptomyces sp. ASQP_92]
MCQARDEVQIVSCADDGRAAGKTGVILDEVPPGPLTEGRWTVKVDAFWIADVLCESGELMKTGKRR